MTQRFGSIRLCLFLAISFLITGVVGAQQTEVVPDGQTDTIKTNRYVLGKLGQVTKAFKIRSRPGNKGSVYYKAKVKEYVVVRPDAGGNYNQILLSNGVWGYAPNGVLEVLPYTVKSAEPIVPGRARVTLSSRSRAAIAQYAENFVGTPYVWGGNSLTGGIDCSGFVKNLYGKIGLNLPRTAAEQMSVGTPITRLEDLRAGDRLYFWDSKRGKIGHTGIYKGNGYFIHSSRTTKGVGTSYLNEKWRRILIAARR